MVALLCFLVFFSTLVIEWRRRVVRGRKRVAHEWSEVEALMREKGLAQDQREALVALLRRRDPQHPYRAVTRRNHFDECMAAEMAALRASMDPEELDALGESWRSIRIALGLDFVPLGQGIGSTRELYLEQHLWVAPASGREPSQWHPAKVTAVNEAYFYLSPEDGAAGIREGSQVHCRMWREDDGRYAFDAELARQQQPGGWRMLHTSALRRTQARSHYRITHEQPAEIAILEAPLNGVYEGALERTEIAHVHGRVTSLSGGGFAVMLSQPLPAQVLLRLALDLDEPGGALMVAGRVVGSQSLFGGRYLVRCAFVDLSEERRDHITQYVFRRQTHLPKQD